MKHALSLLALVGLGLFVWLGTACSKKESAAAASDIDYYTCAMHPSVHQNKPGPCPICGMELVPVKKKSTPEKTPITPDPKPGADHSQHRMPPNSKNDKIAVAEGSPEVSSFQISPERLQVIGVRSGVVTKERLQRLLRTPGIVVVDEGSLRDINVKVAGGYVNKLYVSVTGQRVKKGEPLASILSEGWIEAQQQYIKAYRDARRSVTSANGNSFVIEQQINRMRARLRVWDLSDTQLKKLEEYALNVKDFDFSLREGQGQGLRGTFELLSPVDGIVLQKEAVEGMKFEPGQSLFRLAALSPIWIDAEFPEDQAPYVAVGHEFDVALPALPDFHAKAKVSFIYPQLNPETRRLKARFVVSNPDTKLLPGMYANVSCALEYGEKLSVPFDAVIPTGDRFVVFLDHGGGKLEPRFVKIGEKLGNSYQVLEGLKEGDRVVTSANFLIDSESRIQGALKNWGSQGGKAKAPTGHEGMPGM